LTSDRSSKNKSGYDISNSFPILITIVLIVVALMILVENGIEYFNNNQIIIYVLLAAVFLIAVFLFTKFREEFIKTSSSIRLAIVILFFILFASIIGTLILQNETKETYDKFYGSALLSVLEFLKFTDIFHSYHFRTLIILLCFNILFCVFKRKPFNKVQFGFFLTHFGIITILLGSSLSSFFQLKGYIHFFKGKSVSKLQMTKGNSDIENEVMLGFSVKLADFNVEMYEKVYRLYLYERIDHSKGHNFKVISSYDPQIGKIIQIPDDDTEIKILEFVSSPSSCPEGKYILNVKAEEKDTSEIICIEPGKKLDVPGYEYTVELLKFLPHFNFDMKTREYVSLSDNPVNPAIYLYIKNKVDPEDSDKTWLFSKMPDFGMMHNKKEFPFKLVFQFETSDPALKLEVKSGSETSEKILKGDGEVPIFFRDNSIVLAFQQKPEEVKDYMSTLEIIEEGNVVKSQIVEVNKPLVYDGYYFYQSNYNPDDPDYSGIQVVKDPGIFIVYFGFIVLISGLIYIFYLKPIFKRSKRAEP